jgi:Tfp pilus assembly protein PilF
LGLGASKMGTRELPEAEKYFLKGLELEPSSGQINFNLGMVKAQQNKFDEAIPYLTKAVESVELE